MKQQQADASIAQQRADVVWGQPDFQVDACNQKQPVATVFCNPWDAVTDSDGNLWVTDANRVLMFPYDPSLEHARAVPTKVLGQRGVFTTNGCNQPPPGVTSDLGTTQANTLCNPQGLAVDNHGSLYVADSGNNRVLVYFHVPSKPADPSWKSS
jgi:sugar lactone lactonase YvrE